MGILKKEHGVYIIRRKLPKLLKLLLQQSSAIRAAARAAAN